MPDNTTANKRLAKNSVVLSIRMVIVLFITFYTTRVILATLGVGDYGVYNVVCGFVSMFSFLNTSMSNGIQRFFNYELGKNGANGANRVYNTALIIQGVLAFIILFIVEGIGVWYLHNKMVIPDNRMFAAEWIFQFSIVSFLFVIMQSPYTAAVMAHERLDFYAYVSIFDIVLSLLIVLLLPHIPCDSLLLYGFLYLSVKAINFFIYFFYCRRNFEEIKLNNVFSKSLFKEMLVFSGWNVFGTFSSVAREHGVSLIMNLFFGPVVNAARGVATQINGGLQSFVHNITTPVRPQVVQSYAQGNLGRTMKLTYSISKLSCYFLTILALPICLEIDFVLKVWLGNNIPDHASTFAIIVIACSYQGNLNAAISGVVHATGHMSKYQIYCSIVKLISVPVAYLLLRLGMNPEAALLTVFAFDILGHMTALLILRTLLEFSIVHYVKKVILPILSVLIISLFVAIGVHKMINNDIIRLILVTIASTISVCVSFYYLGLDDSERGLVFQLVKSIRKKNRI